MLYAWPSHSICLHASPNASSCIPTVPTTGTDAHRVIWPSDAWSRAVCGYIVPEKYYEATRWQLYNQQEQQKKPQQCWRKSWSEAKTSPTHFFLFFLLHRWHQQLLVTLCFLKDVQLLIWRKKSICGNVCESIQARGYTTRTADVRDGGCLLEPLHKCFWAFLPCVPQLSTYCGSSRSSQREWYVWADGVRQHTCSPHFHWLMASSRCRCNSWPVSGI